MSGGRGARTTGAGVCAECVRVCEDAIARRMFLLISKSEFICDFLLAETPLISPAIFFCIPYLLIGILEQCVLAAADWREIYCFLLWTKCEHLRLWRWREGGRRWRQLVGVLKKRAGGVG